MVCNGAVLLNWCILFCNIWIINAIPFRDAARSPNQVPHQTQTRIPESLRQLFFFKNNSRGRLKGPLVSLDNFVPWRPSVANHPSHSRSLPTWENPVTQEFSTNTLVHPKWYHSKTKRSLRHTWDQDGHHSHIIAGFVIDGENVLLDLYLNRDLLSKGYYEKQIHENGSHKIHRPSPTDCGMCHYQGSIRDRPGSWAALSTCHGVRGVVFDGQETHYIEPSDNSTSISSPHHMLKHSHLINKNQTCGYKGQPHPIRDLFQDEDFARLLRAKRSSETSIRGPFNAGPLSRFVELVLVTDKSEYEKYNHDVEKLYKRCKDIANIVNALYQPLNIFIALVGVEVWKDKDQVDISTDGDKTLTNFLNYRKVRLIPEHPNDNAQLLTGKVFDSGVVGKALKGPICTYQYSGGVNMDHSESVGLVATTVAHEMGHNFGMEHDTEDCKCPDKRCIMAPSSGTKSPSDWSSCSHEYLAISFERSMDYCLRNKPTSLFQSPVCGNGFVEPGEQCDCGLPQHCNNPCCDATTCMLFSNATCATGHCCDLETCRPKSAGTECRSAIQECDLPEYCSGDSEYCPQDVYKENGHSCLSGKAYCYEGMCKTHEHQCRLLWGPTGRNSHERCYQLNLEGNTNGNCGYNWVNDSYKRCDNGDVKCGMMHCKHFNERLEFGMESVSKVSHRFIADKSRGAIPCRVAQVDLGLDMVDPGLAPDGAKCGYNKMCVNQHCLEVASLRLNTCSCHDKGVCNNKGHCHCEVGFAWPDCIYPGLGGSEDSGPASNPNATSRFVMVMFIFFLGIVPLSLLIAFIYYARGSIKLWWLRRGRKDKTRMNGKAPKKPSSGRSPSMFVEVLSKPTTTNGPSVPTPPSSQGSKSNSPLLNGHTNGVQERFFGRHEGFTLSPIKDKPSTQQDTTTEWAATSKTQPTKVDISGPSLQASTNPAVGPSRPPVPKTDPPVAVVMPSRRAPTRPLSVPDASALGIRQSPSVDSDTDSKDGKQSTVARLASFLSKKERSETPEAPQSPQSNTLPRKASKIKKQDLLQLEISHPMQLHATDLPSNLVPVRAAPEPPKNNAKQVSVKSPVKVSFAPAVEDPEPKSDLTRIGSVRENPVTVRPFIPKFGSLRAPRPKSLPPARPSQPPPRPPLPKIPGTPESEYLYDDGFSMQKGPLASSEEFSSPQESIYATIDEDSPESEVPQVKIEEPKKKSIFSRLYAKSKKKTEPKAPEITEPLYCNIEVEVKLGDQIKPEAESLENPLVTEEPGGLLSEIVSELANREPQYINTISEDSKPKLEPTAASMIKSSSCPTSNPPLSNPKKTQSSPELSRKNNAKPRGVYSFMKKTDSQDSSSSGSSKPKPEATVQKPTENSKAVNPSKSVPSSLASSVAAARAAGKVASQNASVLKTGKSFDSAKATTTAAPKTPTSLAPLKTNTGGASKTPTGSIHPKIPSSATSLKTPTGLTSPKISTAASSQKVPANTTVRESSQNVPAKTRNFPPDKIRGNAAAKIVSTTKKTETKPETASTTKKQLPKSSSAKPVVQKPSSAPPASKTSKEPVNPLQKRPATALAKQKSFPPDKPKETVSKASDKKIPRATTAPLSKSGVLAAAARPATGASNVAALQQKFESSDNKAVPKRAVSSAKK